jgi:hypothetical protein
VDFEKGSEEASDKVVRVRLRLAQSFINMLLTAYDALLTHGINYRNLPAYKDETLLDEARSLPVERGHDSFIVWMGHVHNDIKEAIRRKGFKKV